MLSFLFLCAIAELTGLRGILVAKNALKYHRQTQSDKGSLFLKLICATLLVLACLIILLPVLYNQASSISFLSGWLLAIIGTLPLTAIRVEKVIEAIRQNQYVYIWRDVLKMVLNCFALLIYLVFLLQVLL